MKKLMLALLLIPSFSFAENVVLNGIPDSMVASNDAATERHNLVGDTSKQNEYRVLITKKDGKYYWATRENKELIHKISGAMHIFIETNGAGYIEIFDKSVLPESVQPSGRRFIYKEHLRTMLSSITYWGRADAFNP